MIKEENEELNDKWVNWISSKNDLIRKEISNKQQTLESKKKEVALTINIDNTTADNTKDQPISTEPINLAEAFRAKKKNLAEKISNRENSVREGKLRTAESVDKLVEKKELKNEPLESKLMRKKFEKVEEKQDKKPTSVSNNEVIKIASATVNLAEVKATKIGPKGSEPSPELLERLVYGKKVNVIHYTTIYYNNYNLLDDTTRNENC